MSGNINVTEMEIEYVSLEDPLNIYRSVSNETTIPNINKMRMLLLNQEKEKSLFRFEKLCEEQGFPYLLPLSRFGYNAP